MMELLISKYLDIKEFVINSGYFSEIDWQVESDFSTLNESEFLAEAAWVILTSGFRESTISIKFPFISLAFYNWSNSNYIYSRINTCYTEALNIFNNKKKIKAICKIIEIIATKGFYKVKENINTFGLNYLKSFPFIGPITGTHLLKNIGFDIAKPDRHLVRIASVLGFSSVNDLCKSINSIVGDSIAEIDIVLWRYAILRPDYIKEFNNLLSQTIN